MKITPKIIKIEYKRASLNRFRIFCTELISILDTKIKEHGLFNTETS